MPHLSGKPYRNPEGKLIRPGTAAARREEKFEKAKEKKRMSGTKAKTGKKRPGKQSASAKMRKRKTVQSRRKTRKRKSTKKSTRKSTRKTPKVRGFKANAAKIAKRQGVSAKGARAILASAARKASASAKRKNPRLKRVKG